MICRRLCLVTDVGDNAKLISNNENGWLAYSFFVNALDEALEKCWIQQNNWQEMGELAHQSIKKNIDIDFGKTFFEELING